MQQVYRQVRDQNSRGMSGFDRVLFRGSLRRLTHSRMKWYLAENNILCKALPRPSERR